MRVLILGAGFGGLELSTLLSEQFGEDLDVVLIDRSDHFVFGFSKLDVMFGRTTPDQVRHRYVDVVKPGVEFVQAAIHSIDAQAKRVETDTGEFTGDILVVALGADLDAAATPGLLEGGHEFYTNAGAFGARDAVAGFGGGRVVVGVTSTPFKCPPAPSETALLMSHYLESHGLRDSSVSLVMPLPVPVPPSPDASRVILAAFAERGIEWLPGRLVSSLDPARKVAVLSDRSEVPYDLFLGVPVHRAPAVVLESGLAVDGWVPVDPLTLETRFPDVYALGDVASVGTPKAGVFAEGQARVVAARIASRIRGEAEQDTYDGHGVCYMEFGAERIAKVDVTFVSGRPPVGTLEGPSGDLMSDKIAFGRTRARRWFGRDWTLSADAAAR